MRFGRTNYLSWLGCLVGGVMIVSQLACSAGPDIPDCDKETVSEMCQVFRLVNLERADHGLSAYEWNYELALAAQLHADEMVEHDYFGHESLDGRSFSDRARDVGYEGIPRAENIAVGYRDPQQVMETWMDFSGHRANIFSDADEMGVGFTDYYWVQVFGQRVQ